MALGVALVGDVLLDDGQCGSADCRDEVAVGPQSGHPGLEVRVFLAQQPGGSAFDSFDEPVDAVLGVHGYQQVNVIRHGFQFHDGRALLIADLSNDLFESLVNVAGDDVPPVFGAPHDVVGAAVRDVVIGSDLVHAQTIWRAAV